MKKLMSIMLAVLLVGVPVFAGGSSDQGSGGSKKDVVVVFIPKISGNAFFEVANEGAQKLAKQVGFTVKYDGSPDAAEAVLKAAGIDARSRAEDLSTGQILLLADASYEYALEKAAAKNSIEG